MAGSCISTLLALLLFAVSVHNIAVALSINKRFVSQKQIRKSVFRSPAFALAPGEVSNRFYRIEFPKGHLAVREYNAEIVDEGGMSVPLHEAYMHHWIIFNKNVKSITKEEILNETNYYSQNNVRDQSASGANGVCHHAHLRNFWGLGSETRHTNTSIPPPYAMVVGDPNSIPHGFEEIWELNLHVIDTRGVEDRTGCTECRCSLYNVTVDEHGQALPKDYIGGLKCCYDGTQCKLKRVFEDARRILYMQYTVHWVEWDESTIPLKTYILDVTNTGSGCKVEYNIPVCLNTRNLTDCLDTRETIASLPESSEIIYVVGHQHAGGQGASLYHQNGGEICKSLPTYGHGTEVGDEAGYVVGMSACYPEPGKRKINSKDVLRLQSNYTTSRGRTGVMGIFYLLVAPDRSQISTINKSAKLNINST